MAFSKFNKNQWQFNSKLFLKKKNKQQFPGGPVVSTPYSPAKGLSSVPGQGTKVLQAVQPKEKEKKKNFKK